MKPFEVGKSYRIPCVAITAQVLGLRSGDYLPVLGPEHEDREVIGIPHRHWHIDFRFVSKRLWDQWGQRYEGHAHVHGKVITTAKTTGELTVRRLRCKREMPTFPVEIVNLGVTRTIVRSLPIPWLAPLEEALAGQRIKPGCATCPHRGISLASIRPNADGLIVCPGHGLAWDATTGELVRRTTRPMPPDSAVACQPIEPSTTPNGARNVKCRP